MEALIFKPASPSPHLARFAGALQAGLSRSVGIAACDRDAVGKLLPISLSRRERDAILLRMNVPGRMAAAGDA
ncbi:MAG: hypothetical protein DCF28_14110 [Alphaproteobacteria bacterium]|nr:MAG: hypothetical protein DCF28_14110 [Alphaproteobacteria bacterium]PZO31953.1 MAG: hypothetical protein DCE92_14520 [Alphaproteobacteria bacterium]